jgi:hypothetical protein
MVCCCINAEFPPGIRTHNLPEGSSYSFIKPHQYHSTKEEDTELRFGQDVKFDVRFAVLLNIYRQAWLFLIPSE